MQLIAEELTTNEKVFADITEIGACCEDDDVIYLAGVPCKLSTVKADESAELAALRARVSELEAAIASDAKVDIANLEKISALTARAEAAEARCKAALDLLTVPNNNTELYMERVEKSVAILRGETQ